MQTVSPFKSKSALTIMELLVVVIIMAIVAGFTIPNYTASREKNFEREMYATLRTIKNAINMYLVRNEATTIPNMANIDAINATLGLSLMAAGNYALSCTGTLPDQYTCSMNVVGNTWVLRITESSVNEVFCAVGTCPSCKSDASGGCTHFE